MIVRGSALVNPGKIMVRATNWIGDAVLSLPAIEALRSRFPEAELVVVSKPWVSELYERHPAVSRQIVYDPGSEHRGARGFWKLVEQLRAEEFDAAVLLPNAFHAAWMAWCARIPARLGYERDGREVLLTHPVQAPPAAACDHQVNYYLELLFRAGVIRKPEPVEEVRLALSPSERAWAGKQLESLGLHGPRFLVGLCPGASFGPAKRWPLESYADLGDRLVEGLHADILVFGSADEAPLAEGIAHQMEHTPTILAGKATLRQFMALVSCCRLVVSNDSGPMHIAAALGVPLVAVFGSTDERATDPVGKRVRVVKHSVPCSPCGLRECPIDFRCMMELEVAEVYRMALELVKEG